MEAEEVATSPTSGGETGRNRRATKKNSGCQEGGGSLPVGDLEGQINGITGRLPPAASSAIRPSAPSCGTHQDVERALRALLVLLDGGEHGQHETGEDQ